MSIRALSLVAAPLAAALVIPAAVARPALAASAPKVGPDQIFAGAVNGKVTGATVTVLCPGPVRAGETGHPIGGQYVSAFPVVDWPIPNGYTGSAAKAIVANFVTVTPPQPAATPGMVITRYNVDVAIPTSLSLPCGGTGSVDFAPVPTSPTGRPISVAVTFLNIGV